MHRIPAWLLTLIVIASLPAAAQQPAGSGKTGADSGQVEITADQGIEWDKASGTYTARGNAKVTRGDRSIIADRITAYHRGAGTRRSDIYRVDAQGSVKLSERDSVISGDRLVYEADTRVARLTGRNLTITSPDSKVTARDSIEYWEEKRMAVARGNVVVRKGSEEMRADQAVAFFEPKDGSAPAAGKSDSREKQRLARVEGYGHVYIASCNGFAHADKAVYDPNTGTAILSGNVRLTRGREQVNGATVEMNTRTGYTRIVAGAGGRVYATIDPDKDGAKPDARPTDRPGAPPCDDKQTATSPGKGSD